MTDHLDGQDPRPTPIKISLQGGQDRPRAAPLPVDSTVEVWERLPDEPEWEWSEFVKYRDERSPRRRPGSFGQTAKFMRTYSDWRWGERVVAYDRNWDRIKQQHVSDILRQPLREVAAEQRQMLSDLTQLLSINAHRYLKLAKDPSIEFPTLKPGEFARLLPDVVKLMRLVQGESTENVAKPVNFSHLSLEELRQAEEIAEKMLDDGPEGEPLKQMRV
jgi:hypothetical protein